MTTTEAMTVTEVRIEMRREIRSNLADWIRRHHDAVQYVNAKDTIAWVNTRHTSLWAVIDFARQIGAIDWKESSECCDIAMEIQDTMGCLIKCARLPVRDGERARHYSHLKSHKVAALAARVATMKSILLA